MRSRFAQGIGAEDEGFGTDVRRTRAIMMGGRDGSACRINQKKFRHLWPKTFDATAIENRLDPGVVALGWVSFLSDVASDMIYPAPARLPDPDARRRARRPRSDRGGRRGDGLPDEARLGLVVGPGPAPQAAGRRRLLDRRRRAPPGRRWPRAGARCWRSDSPTGSARGSARRRATPSSPTSCRPRSAGAPSASSARWTTPARVAGPLLAAAPAEFVVDEERTVFLLAPIPGLAARVLLLSPSGSVRAQTGPGPAPRSACGAAPAGVLARDRDLRALHPRATRRTRSSFSGRATRAFPSGSSRCSGPFFNGVKAAAGVPGGASPTGSGGSRRSSRDGGLRRLLRGIRVRLGPAAVWGLFALLRPLLRADRRRGASARRRPRARAAARPRLRRSSTRASGSPRCRPRSSSGCGGSASVRSVAFLIGAGIAVVAAAALLVFRRRHDASAGGPAPDFRTGGTDSISPMGPVWRLIRGRRTCATAVAGRSWISRPWGGSSTSGSSPRKSTAGTATEYLPPFLDDIAPDPRTPSNRCPSPRSQ